MTPPFNKIRENMPYWAYKYRFELQKGVKKNKNIFSVFKSMMSQLSNALSTVLISLKLVKLHQIDYLSVAPIN